jgi:hypothetical protein
MFMKKPIISEIELSRDYKFMYENFVVATQQETYLFLDKQGETIHALKFDSSKVKYGGPNDESRGAHPLTKYGDLMYGFYEVKNSPWIKEQMEGNRCHPQHSDTLFEGKKHYIACFKDVMFEVTCRKYTEVALTAEEVTRLISSEIGNLDE